MGITLANAHRADEDATTAKLMILAFENLKSYR